MLTIGAFISGIKHLEPEHKQDLQRWVTSDAFQGKLDGDANDVFFDQLATHMPDSFGFMQRGAVDKAIQGWEKLISPEESEDDEQRPIKRLHAGMQTPPSPQAQQQAAAAVAQADPAAVAELVTSLQKMGFSITPPGLARPSSLACGCGIAGV
jgi:hypothetical protein